MRFYGAGNCISMFTTAMRRQTHSVELALPKVEYQDTAFFEEASHVKQNFLFATAGLLSDFGL
jgi:hypothetical protein